MVTTIHDSRPTSILDLGAGQGILLSAASERWRQAKLYGADLDADKVGLLAVRLPQAVCRQLDALKQNLPKLIGLDEGSVDLALCNPPYGRRPLGRRGTALLQGAGLAGCIATERITEDILFIAQNLRLLRDGGELAVIVPDGFATGHHYRDFRAALLERHALHRVLALPSDLFRGTEARTHVLFLKKNKGAATETVLEGFQGHQISISPKQAVERLDIAYYEACFEGRGDTMELGELALDVARGQLDHRQCREAGAPYFHTTDFKHFPDGELALPKMSAPNERQWVAVGDILIPRVGARCLQYAGRVQRGSALFTDCIYRLRMPDAWRSKTYDALRSPDGIRWRLANANGACSRSLSKARLLRFPIPI